MQNFFYVILFILGLLFWSFASVLIYRLKSNEWWILNGRSHCSKCKNVLKFFDLFPIFSFLSTFWKCHYCKAKISFIYPILELSTWLLFALIWYFLIDVNLILIWDFCEIIKLIFWLAIWFITILYVFYDILFLEIHEWIMLFWVILAIIWLIFNTLRIQILPTISIFQNNFSTWILSIILWLIIIWELYIIMLKELQVIYDIWIIIFSIILIFIFTKYFDISPKVIPMISWIIWALWIFIFFYLQILFSKWRALWCWDLRIWIMIWLILGMSYTIWGMMIIYLVWSILSILLLIFKNIKYKKIETIVPFWPFMWIGFFLTIFSLPQITNFIEIYFTTL
jgi:leader peptidase (prepilin peptidase)/N-methyltransferase